MLAIIFKKIEKAYETVLSDHQTSHNKKMKMESSKLLEKDEDPTKNCMPDKRKIYGILLALVSGLFQTLKGFLLKYTNVDPGDVVIVKAIIQLIVMTVWCLLKKQRFFYFSSKVQLLLLGNSIFSGMLSVFYYQAVHRLPLGDAMAYLFSAPMFSRK